MPDTDDDQSVELEPDQREQGDDDTEAARERRAAQARAEAGKDLSTDVTESDAERRAEEDEQLRLDEEEDQEARAERLELARKDQQELDEHRDREELKDATAETTRAMQLAYADEEARDRYRQYAANDKQRGLSDRAHGRHELDEAAAHPDEPGSAGLAAEGRRYQNAATIEERKYVADHDIADAYDSSARDHRREAAEAQPSASEAVRKAPEDAPEAQLPQARRHVRGPGRVRTKQGKVVKPNRASEPDLEL
ncbi:hypothetical protein [Kribbella shirazensis]|uniref:Uncharacterized protein n=1 Tax=Kribbella shirazensis TaxID=1105143 RepID=A0A7X5V6L1_9ACTN|nr:hypothetical protein [Kribbella shirazensis]NIK55573.1 hypothetical protein [Kribbella shirazensis]